MSHHSSINSFTEWCSNRSVIMCKWVTKTSLTLICFIKIHRHRRATRNAGQLTIDDTACIVGEKIGEKLRHAIGQLQARRTDLKNQLLGGHYPIEARVHNDGFCGLLRRHSSCDGNNFMVCLSIFIVSHFRLLLIDRVIGIAQPTMHRQFRNLITTWT